MIVKKVIHNFHLRSRLPSISGKEQIKCSSEKRMRRRPRAFNARIIQRLQVSSHIYRQQHRDKKAIHAGLRGGRWLNAFRHKIAGNAKNGCCFDAIMATMFFHPARARVAASHDVRFHCHQGKIGLDGSAAADTFSWPQEHHPLGDKRHKMFPSVLNVSLASDGQRRHRPVPGKSTSSNDL